MKKNTPLAILSSVALVGAAIAACTSFSSGPADNGTGGTNGGGTGGATDNGTGGSATGAGGSTDTGAGGSTTGAGGSTTAAGGTTGATGGKTGAGGTIGGLGGTTGLGGATGAGGSVVNTNLPCDIFNAAGNTCVAAHSTIRQLYSKYTGPLYQVCKGGGAQTGPNSCTGGTTMDIPQVNGFANSAVQDTFCAGTTCTIYTIYDQSGMGNFLRPSPKGGNSAGANAPAVATALKLTANGHPVYGVYIRRLQGYRAGCSACAVGPGAARGVATGDQAETEYMVTSQNKLIDGCCFDYGNAETTSNDDRAGTMEAVYFGGGAFWDTGAEGGHSDTTNPWVMADLEDGLYAGWSTTAQPSNTQQILTNTALHFNYVTALIIGDTAAQNAGKGRFAIMGGDATAATPLKVMYDGMRPTLSAGYLSPKKEGSIILGTGGDNSNQAEGYFFEGVMTQGAASTATITAVQASIAAAKYGQ